MSYIPCMLCSLWMSLLFRTKNSWGSKEHLGALMGVISQSFPQQQKHHDGAIVRDGLQRTLYLFVIVLTNFYFNTHYLDLRAAARTPQSLESVSHTSNGSLVVSYLEMPAMRCPYLSWLRIEMFAIIYRNLLETQTLGRAITKSYLILGIHLCETISSAASVSWKRDSQSSVYLLWWAIQKTCGV